MNWEPVQRALEEAAAKVENDSVTRGKAFPGAVLLVGRGGDVLFQSAVGVCAYSSEPVRVSESTVFDIASLTKALVVSGLMMQFVEEGKVDIDYRVSRILQTFGTYGKEQITLRHLLSHSAGFPAVLPLYRRVQEADRGARAGVLGTRAAAQLVVQDIFRTRLDNMPGKATTYSDLGYMLLGHILEVLAGETSLDRLATTRLCKPLGLRDTGYIDLGMIRRHGLSPVTERIAATLDCSWRKRLLCGEVHDDNAWAMGGVAGHAGVFSTAADVHRMACEFIEAYHGRDAIFSQEVVRHFWQRDTTVPGSTWALGWDTPTRGKSSSGDYFTDSAVGHLGYTGCSLWIDPVRELDVVLLTNRIHPNDSNTEIRAFRPLIHNLVMEALGYASGGTS